ncbi:membrane protein [Scheffersomyces stipitis CBS 6054]|uniref:Membrane protein n=1 Tax=Scheffersomyces stipitis (strain ATCC 58785 / CBS 6054 / NBRC 10063 / NRRL Y-11545) TaxID=322104 RepID=A3LQG0_PICST|nr:membrane protein [Scheffersomyces stipitis CBS 6054]ABN65202.1 membrane protein [Scheffersomyces stipitis CBS 6054]
MKSAFGKVLTVLFVFFQYSTALHFYLRTGDTRCFYEELQEDTLVVGKIDAYEKNDQGEYFKNGNLRVEITVDETFDNDERVVTQKSSPSGEFTFTSHEAGEHKFCLKPVYNDGTIGKAHRVFFDIASGSAHDYADSKSTKQVDSLTAKVQNLNTKLEEIHYEQEHMREREAMFRNQSESTNSRVVKWTLVQLVVLIGTCFYQLRHLKSFFVKQKIV